MKISVYDLAIKFNDKLRKLELLDGFSGTSDEGVHSPIRSAETYGFYGTEDM